jgi:uncharacterized protein
MEIVLSHISDKEKFFEFEERSEDLGLPAQFGMVSAGIYIYTLGEKYYARGQVRADAGMTCDICLDPYTTHFEESFEVIVEKREESQDTEDEEIIAIPLKALAINFNDYLRDQLLLAVPIQKRCKPDCKGLCPVCGANQNREVCSHDTKEADPRWDVLKNMKETMENPEN